MRFRGGPSVESMRRLRVAGRVSTAQVDKVLADTSAHPQPSGPVLLDLSSATSFDVVALQQLLSLFAARRDAGLDTRIRLPVDAAARHVLRQWQFPLAAGSVARVPFRDLVMDEDRAYFREQAPPASAVPGSASPRASVLAYLTAQRRFGLRPYRIDGASARLRILEDEVSCWGGFALTRLLRSMLAGPAPEVIRVLVQELVSGPLLQRWYGKVAITGAQLELPGQGPGAGTLTLAIWDDSESLISELRKRDLAAELPRTEEFTVAAQGWSPGEEPGRGSWQAWPDSEDPEVLLAGLMRSTPRDRSAGGGAEGSDGMYALYNCAVDVFGGSLCIASRQTRLTISAAPAADRARYRVEVAAGPQLPDQHGNLLAVRLPVRDG
ncbi:hypothetical protein [Streptomyces sp. NBC_01381]|uniref:hypothetical protein n=1 Tax=Streptomyces sp. NBC_01381 TaxID=2903845 RepID=UPI002254CC42|nr:hypothetical protein [Streptomyces sp. NBC_01381]